MQYVAKVDPLAVINVKAFLVSLCQHDQYCTYRVLETSLPSSEYRFHGSEMMMRMQR